jgi:hypothetical protein
MHQRQNNKYEVLLLPIDYNKSFLDCSKEKIHAYYEWFLGIKDERLRYLCNFLFSDSKDCLREDNLRVIEIFLTNSISVVPKPKAIYAAEMKKVPLPLKSYAKPDNYLLDKATISICYDVGIFLGNLIITLDNKIKWGA